MNRTLAAGATTTVASLVGYGVGTVLAYPGRELSLAGFMIGLTVLIIGAGGADS